MTSHDITFCISHVCPSRDTCRRAHPPNDVIRIPVMDFYKPGTQMCASYWPIWREKS